MKLFIDSAIPDEITKMWDAGIIDGVTTNPSLAAKAGLKYKDAVRQILSTVDGDISLEVLSTDTSGMVREGKELAKMHHNVVVKIPTTTEGLKALKILNQEGIRVNMTLVFSANQALLVAKQHAYIVSPFAGRLDDIGHTSLDLISEMRQIYDNYHFETQILFASVRSPLQVKQAALAGSDIATLPFDILGKLVEHPLTDIGLKQFLSDFKESNQEPLV